MENLGMLQNYKTSIPYPHRAYNLMNKGMCAHTHTHIPYFTVYATYI